MKRALFLLALMAVLGLCAQDTIRIGVVLPLSGPQQTNGLDCQRAVQLRLEDLHDTRYAYEVFFEDGQGSPRVSQEAFMKLVNVDKVDVVFSIMGAAGSTLGAAANAHGVVHIGSGWSADIAKAPYSFNNFATPQLSARLMAEFVQQLGFDSVAMISQQNASTNTLEAAFADIQADYGIETVCLEKFVAPERDFRVMIMKVRQTNPDLVLVHAFDPEAEIIVNQMHQMGYYPPISAIGQWGACHTDALDGYPWSEIVIDPTFAKRMRQHIDHPPFVISGPIYDSTDMIIRICEVYGGDGKPSADYIARTLEQTQNFPGVMGYLSEADHWIGIPSTMAMQNKGVVEPIDMPTAMELAKKKYGNL